MQPFVEPSHYIGRINAQVDRQRRRRRNFAIDNKVEKSKHLPLE
jgi:hypothetical protein